MSKQAASDLALRSTETGLAAVGGTKRWATDLAFVGAVSGAVAPLAFAPMMAMPAATYAVIAGAAGAATGLALGLVAPKLLTGLLRNVPVGALLVGGIALGGAWGGLVGAITATAISPHPELLHSSVEIAAIAGAIQLGWWWLPYLMRLAKGKSTWPLMLAAAALAPFLGWIGLYVSASLFW